MYTLCRLYKLYCLFLVGIWDKPPFSGSHARPAYGPPPPGVPPPLRFAHAGTMPQDIIPVIRHANACVINGLANHGPSIRHATTTCCARPRVTHELHTQCVHSGHASGARCARYTLCKRALRTIRPVCPFWGTLLPHKIHCAHCSTACNDPAMSPRGVMPARSDVQAH